MIIDALEEIDMDTIVKTAKPAKYKVALEVNDKIIKSEAVGLLDALDGLEKETFKTKGTLRVSRGKRKWEKTLFPKQLKHALMNRMTLLITAKKIESTLK